MTEGVQAGQPSSGAADDEIDVFVSYAHADDERPTGAEHGWVTTLVEELRKVLRRKLGGAGARIWMDHQLAAHHHVTDTLTRRAAASRTLVLVLSPGYLKSDWCRRELATFWTAAQAMGKAGSIFPIEIDCIARSHYPGPIADLSPLPFWERSGPNGVPTLAGFPRPKAEEDGHYWQQVNLLAHGLATHLARAPVQPLPARSIPPVVPALSRPAPATATPKDTTPTSEVPHAVAVANGAATLQPLATADDDDILSVYLHGAPEDQRNVELVADHLAALGVQVLMTPEPGDGKTYLDCLREQRDLLRECQGFLLVRGQSPAANLQVAYQLAQQAFGLRRRDAWAAAINLPPPNRPSVPIRSPNLVQVDCTGGFRPEVLLPYLAGLKAARTARVPQPQAQASSGAGHV